MKMNDPFLPGPAEVPPRSKAESEPAAPDLRYFDEQLRRTTDKLESLVLEEEGQDPMRAAALRALLEEYRVHEVGAKELRREARIDPLTKLLNRRAFADAINEKIGSMHRRIKMGETPSLCVIAIDIDHFKQINDRYGHNTGDEYLQAIARHLKGALRRGEDVLARMGGDEFSVLIPDAGPEVAHAVGQKLLDAVNAASAEAKLVLEKRIHAQKTGNKGVFELLPLEDGNVTASIGYAFLEDREPAEHVMKRADFAAYVVKESGRHGVESYEEAMRLDSDGAMYRRHLNLSRNAA